MLKKAAAEEVEENDQAPLSIDIHDASCLQNSSAEKSVAAEIFHNSEGREQTFGNKPNAIPSTRIENSPK